jgi:O-antigen/teichoic acid export membrane protein
VSSLQNFMLGIFVARTLGAVALGALGLAFLVYATVLGAHRGLSTDPLAVRFSGPPNRRWTGAAAAAGGTALVVGVVAGGACATAGALLWWAEQEEVGTALLALGVTLPGLTWQDSWRYAFFSSGRGAKAFANDVAWTLCMVAALACFTLMGLDGVGWALLAFGGTAYLAALLGCLQARLLPSLRRAPSWLVKQRDLGLRFLVENITLGAGGQVRPAIVTASGGLRAAGGVRGAEMLMGPVLTVLMGVAQVAVPETVRSVARGRRSFRRLCVAISVALATCTALWGVFVLLAFPYGAGELVLGPVWDEARLLLPAVVVSATAGCLHVGPSAGLRALGRADRSLRCQVVATVLFAGLGVLGAATFGALGAVWGTALGSVLAAFVWWTELRWAEATHFAGPVPRAPAPVGDLQPAGPPTDQPRSGRTEGVQRG